MKSPRTDARIVHLCSVLNQAPATQLDIRHRTGWTAKTVTQVVKVAIQRGVIGARGTTGELGAVYYLRTAGDGPTVEAPTPKKEVTRAPRKPRKRKVEPKAPRVTATFSIEGVDILADRTEEGKPSMQLTLTWKTLGQLAVSQGFYVDGS